jgi:hypothetical protein
MFLKGAVSFRGCSAVIQLLEDFLPSFHAIPAPNTTQSWLLRIGLYELTRPKEKADDWVLFIDHTIQLGPFKCLLIVGIRVFDWTKLDRALTHEDLTVLALEPVEQSNGEIILEQIETVAGLVGTPAAIMNDHGSDIVSGVGKFIAKNPATRAQFDIAHQTAIILKHELETDERWEAFTKHCGQTQPKIKQTELAHLAPPTQKVKGRYMNLGPLIAWGEKMLKLLDTPAEARPPGQDLRRLDEKLGWVRGFRQALVDWNDIHRVKDHVLSYARKEGYHSEASNELRTQLACITKTRAGRRVAKALQRFVRKQSQGLKPGESLPASTEVIESLIGKGKRMQGQHSRGGFTKMILGMAASVAKLSLESITIALETVRNCDLQKWCDEHLGNSLTTQRREALPSATGTKPG